MAKKQKTLPQLKKDLDFIFKKKVRLRDCDSHGIAECISCGKGIMYKTAEYHAGHYVPVSRGCKHRWTNENVNVQCSSCNVWKRSNPHEYRKGLIDKYGADIEKHIWETRHETFKPTRDWLIQRIKEEKAEVEILKKTKHNSL